MADRRAGEPILAAPRRTTPTPQALERAKGIGSKTQFRQAISTTILCAF